MHVLLMPFLVSWFLILLLAPIARAEVVILPASADNTLYEDANGSLSNGAGGSLFIGQTINNGLRRALIRFDLTTLPVDTQINSVSLMTTISLSPQPTARPGTASVHRLVADWGEGSSIAPGPGGAGASAEPGDATWIHRHFETDLWTQPGGDFVASSSAEALFSTADFEELNFDSTTELISDVQSWVSSPTTNHGWIMLGDEDENGNARRLNARENSEFQPMLLIDFTPEGLRIFQDGFE